MILVDVYFLRQLAEIKRQLSSLRVQVGTLRFMAADKRGGKPPNGGPTVLEPPEGTRRKGNLWVVPMLFGVTLGLGRSLRQFVYRHRVPIAATAVGAMAAAGAVVYLGGALDHSGGYQAAPPTAPHMVTVPPIAPPPHDAVTVRTLSRSGYQPPLESSTGYAEGAVVPIARRVPPTAAPPSTQHAPAPTVMSVASFPVAAPAPSPSHRYLHLVFDPLFGADVCVGGP